MHNKSETRTHLTNFINFVDETKVKVIKSDNGHEFKMNEFFSSNTSNQLCRDSRTEWDCREKAPTLAQCN